MKILLAVKKLDFGGAENHVVDLANGLAGAGHEIWVAAAEGRRRDLLNPKIHFVRCNFKDHLLIYNVLFLCKLIKTTGISIIHLHQRLPILTGALAGFLCGIPVVATLHGQLKYDLRSSIVKYLISRLIVVCPYWREVVKKKSAVLGPKTVTIPNGISKIDGSVNNNNPFNIMYASRLDHSHGELLALIIQEVIPDLNNHYPEIQLFITGDGNQAEKIRQIAAQTNSKLGRNCIILMGYQDNLLEAFKDMGLILGTGRTALEALAVGKPLLPIRHDLVGEIVTSQNFDYYVYNNFVPRNGKIPTKKELTNLLDLFIKNYQGYCNESQILGDIVRKEFNLGVITEKIINVYEDCLGREIKPLG